MQSEKWILIGLNPHATELIFLMQVPANKLLFFVHSTTRNAPSVHPRLDSILELFRASPIGANMLICNLCWTHAPMTLTGCVRFL